MPDLDRINMHLQERLRAEGLQEVGAVEAARWLHEAGLLRDSQQRPGLPLRNLLQAGEILGQQQRPDLPHGNWFIVRVAGLTGYHAHVYYDAGSRPAAAAVRKALAARFPVRLGRWRRQPVGPHPRPMYQVAFAPEHFGRIVPWLMVHRRGLSVLVHPETGDALGDHDQRALWMGTKLRLRLKFLR